VRGNTKIDNGGPLESMIDHSSQPEEIQGHSSHCPVADGMLRE